MKNSAKKSWLKPVIVDIKSSSVKGGTTTNPYPYEKYVSGCVVNSASTCLDSYGGTLASYSTGQAPATFVACVNSAGTAITAAGMACVS